MAILRTTIDELAREHNEAAIATIAEIMTSPMAEDKDRLRAAELLMDRGNGRPVQAVIQIPAARQKRALLASKSNDELMRIIDEAPLPSLLPVVIDMMPTAEPEDREPDEPAYLDEFNDIDPLLL